MISFSLKNALYWAGATVAGFLAAVVIYNSPDGYWILSAVSHNNQGITFHGVTTPAVFFLAVNYVLIAVMGYALARPFFEGGPVKSLGLKIVSSFFIGYVCLAGVVRLVSFVCPYQSIYWPVLGTELMIVMIACWGNEGCFASLQNWKPLGLMAQIKRWMWVFILAIFLVSVLLLQVSQGDFSWVGHGPNQYARFLDEWFVGRLKHFPMIAQHYDELIVHYFLGMPIQGTLTTIVVWWMTLGLIKMSVFVFMWIVLRKIGLSSILAGLGTSFLFFGSSSLCPWRYYMLFDSSNPLFFTVHSGRVAGVALVIFWIVNFLREDAVKRPVSVFMVVLSGLGMTALPASNVFWVLALLPWLLPVKNDGYYRGVFVVCFFVLAVLLLLYGLPFDTDFGIRSRMLIVGVVFMNLAWVVTTRVRVCILGLFSMDVRVYVKGLAALVLSLLLGMVLLGNVIQNNVLSRWTFHKLEPMIGHLESPALTGEIFSKAPFQIKDFRERGGEYNLYCEGIIEFLSYYGFILVMICLIPFLYSRRSNEGLAMDQHLYGIFVFIVTLIPIIFFIVDFTNLGPQRAWVKTRLLEIPVYFIIFCFVYFLDRMALWFEKVVLGIILTIYIVAPFLANQRPLQIQESGKYLLKVISQESQSKERGK
ncbi:MAG: hypothetical protein HQL22_08925 [Candidatus Omnitrophica bacterium]|nr:hypothetical protein [Candidatus Omnitrophota bacterium]